VEGEEQENRAEDDDQENRVESKEHEQGKKFNPVTCKTISCR
jgi:hypothetical protein